MYLLIATDRISLMASLQYSYPSSLQILTYPITTTETSNLKTSTEVAADEVEETPDEKRRNQFLVSPNLIATNLPYQKLQRNYSTRSFFLVSSTHELNGTKMSPYYKSQCAMLVSVNATTNPSLKCDMTNTI